MESWKDPATAEAQLLELVRGQDAEQFTLTISRVGSVWTVMTEQTLDKAPGKMIGTGATFAEAWHGQDPTWAHDPGHQPHQRGG